MNATDLYYINGVRVEHYRLIPTGTTYRLEQFTDGRWRRLTEVDERWVRVNVRRGDEEFTPGLWHTNRAVAYSYLDQQFGKQIEDIMQKRENLFKDFQGQPNAV